MAKRITLALLIVTVASVAALGSGQSFTWLDPVYQQELYGVTQLDQDEAGNAYVLGGVAFAPDGDPWVAECVFNGTRLHRFDSQVTVTPAVNGTTTLHPETIVNTYGGCGLTNHSDGYLYSNSSAGVYRLDAATGLPLQWPDLRSVVGKPGNALGITPDPRTGHVVYAGADCHPSLDQDATECTIHSLDVTNGSETIFAVLKHTDVNFVDGIYFDPTGKYLFLANRGSTTGGFALTILRRPEDSTPNTAFPQIAQSISTPSEPDGVAFHAASPKFVVTNDEELGTMTKFTFSVDDYTASPTITTFASGGFRGDLLQVGADGCIYATQGRHALGTDPGTRYDDGTERPEDSVVRICGPEGDGFVPGPGVLKTVTGDEPCMGSIGDFVWSDLDGDGVQDAGEPGLANVQMTLKDSNGNVVATTTTNTDGFYEFTAACAGSNTVEVATPAGYAPAPSGVGPNAMLDSNGSPASVTMPASHAIDRSIDFGFVVVQGRISGFTYVDVNKNGVLDAGEPGINGVPITLSGAATGSTATAVNGAYSFNNLAAGTYAVSAPASAAGMTRSTPSPLSVTLSPGEHRPNVNFGYKDITKPVCVVNNALGTMTFQDTGSGIVSLKITKNLNNNFRVTMPTLSPAPYPAGTTVNFNPPSTLALVVSAVRINKSASAQLIVNATDLFGNVFTCDPVVTEVTKLRHERGNQTFTDLPYAEHIVTIENDEPGLNGMDIIVNGTTFEVRRLSDNETRKVDVESAMRRGNHNRITLVPRGKRGDSATVTISDQ